MFSRKVQKNEIMKSKIFYARTYRHLKPEYKNIVIYYMFFALPSIIVFLFSYRYMTKFISYKSMDAIKNLIPDVDIRIAESDFMPRFGKIFFLDLPNQLPSHPLVIANISVVVLLLLIFFRIKDKFKPLAIYITIALVIHLISCLYFMILPGSFPYSISDYSTMYMKQQIGIWLFFLIISSLVSGGITNSGIAKFYMLFGLAAYSFVFGFLRYILYLFILLKGSVLYMAILFFSFGPFFDFLYLVCFYGIYMYFLTKKFDDKKEGVEWQWA